MELRWWFHDLVARGFLSSKNESRWFCLQLSMIIFHIICLWNFGKIMSCTFYAHNSCGICLCTIMRDADMSREDGNFIKVCSKGVPFYPLSRKVIQQPYISSCNQQLWKSLCHSVFLFFLSFVLPFVSITIILKWTISVQKLWVIARLIMWQNIGPMGQA